MLISLFSLAENKTKKSFLHDAPDCPSLSHHMEPIFFSDNNQNSRLNIDYLPQ